MQKLTDLAIIATGVYQKARPFGDTLYLQGKHFDGEGRLREDVVLAQELSMNDKLKRHLLEDGDILLMAKGGNNRACIYKQGIGQAVASSTFFVIRLKEGQVLPEYLHWLLNTSQLQNRLSELGRGTHIRSLSKKMVFHF